MCKTLERRLTSIGFIVVHLLKDMRAFNNKAGVSTANTTTSVKNDSENGVQEHLYIGLSGTSNTKEPCIVTRPVYSTGPTTVKDALGKHFEKWAPEILCQSQ